MSIFREFNINMVPGKPPLIIHVSQYESDFVYTFNLISGKNVLAIPDTAIAVIRGTKRDGNGYSKEASLDTENNKVVVIGEVQMTACAGKNVFELAILNDEKTICTANFFLDVERAPLDSDTIRSETVLHDLQAIINSVATATQAAEEASASAESAASAAEQAVEEKFEDGVAETIDEWLTDHPEATTTVLDGAITEPKLATALKPKVLKDYVTPEMYGAKGDGTTDDLSAFQSAITAMSAGDVLYVPAKTYLLSGTLTINKAITVIGDGTLYVTHANPVLVLDTVNNALIDLAKIEKSARVFDYVEGASNYSIAVTLKNCGGCNVNIHSILNVTTAFLLLADGTGCHYNQIQCDDAHTFTGIEIVRTSNGGWVNGNRVNAFRWMVNTWFDNVNLVAGYMVKSLSNAKSTETEPYKNNGNYFEHLVAEYGAKQADYPILLCRLDYARGYTLNFDRVEISAKNSSLTENAIHFTNCLYCCAFIWFSLFGFTTSVGTLATDHNLVIKKRDFESVSFSGIQSILSSVTFNSDLSYTSNWFQIVKNSATKSVRIFGELIVNAEIASLSHLIEGLPTCRQGWGTMILTPSITETQWQAAGTVTHYKLSITSGRTFLANVGVIPSGTHLFVDFEYLIAEDDL